MTTYNPGDIVLVPFPFTDLTSTKKRPALVISPAKYNAYGDVVIAFVTSNIEGPARPGDYLLRDWQKAGLPLPSKIRMKFATVSCEIVIKPLGRVTSSDTYEIGKIMRSFLMDFFV